MNIFNNFIFNLSIVLLGFDVTIIMDNVSIHNQAQDAVEEDRHRVRKLPPYSPMLNPIELAFSALKELVKRLINERMAEILDRNLSAAANFPMTTYRINILCEIVEQSILVITAEKCGQWKNYMFRYLPACMNLEDILV